MTGHKLITYWDDCGNGGEKCCVDAVFFCLSILKSWCGHPIRGRFSAFGVLLQLMSISDHIPSMVSAAHIADPLDITRHGYFNCFLTVIFCYVFSWGRTFVHWILKPVCQQLKRLWLCCWTCSLTFLEAGIRRTFPWDFLFLLLLYLHRMQTRAD